MEYNVLKKRKSYDKLYLLKEIKRGDTMIKAYAKSDVGKARDINQDSFYIPEEQFPNAHLFILADGMGGCNAGEIASKLAISCSKSYIENNLKETPKDKESLIQLIRK